MEANKAVIWDKVVQVTSDGMWATCYQAPSVAKIYFIPLKKMQPNFPAAQSKVEKKLSQISVRFLKNVYFLESSPMTCCNTSDIYL